MIKRSQTQTERDVESFAAKQKRDAATPEYVCEDLTGKYDGPELERARATRPPLDRIALLEKKNDELLQAVLSMAGTKLVSNTTIIEGKARTWNELMTRVVIALVGLIVAIGMYFLGRGGK